MSDQNPEDTGVWSPPAAEPSWFTPSKRLPRPDARVWPPPEREPRGSSTVPIPVIEDGPAPRRPTWPPPVPTPPAPVPQPFTRPPFSGPPVPPSAAAAVPAPPAPPAPAAPPPKRRRAPIPKVAKIGLQIAGAVGLTAAFLAMRGYDALQRYEKDVPPANVQQVSAGQEATLADAKWRLIGVSTMTDPQAAQQPGRTMLRIELQATPLNADGTRFALTPPGLYLADKAGRTWMVEPWKSPEKLTPGVAGRFTLISLVPKEMVDQVELTLWPNPYLGRQQSGDALRFDR
ncbi:hypothetical protein [Sphaerisporangium corydalis]|uniref:DUF4352 domain-containing protein n=1 Tax=Sphaerisporangium corydalis TaxID=1441875 RepID=A0ABV9EQB3_9ACTN|nr:hypothetical protein [Sphaerisporangium corydalis]